MEPQQPSNIVESTPAPLIAGTPADGMVVISPAGDQEKIVYDADGGWHKENV